VTEAKNSEVGATQSYKSWNEVWEDV